MFWQTFHKYPAMSVAISAGCGSAFALSKHPAYLIAIVIFLYVFRIQKRLWLVIHLAICLLMFSYSHWRINERAISSAGKLQVVDISYFLSPIRKNYRYHVYFDHFKGEIRTKKPLDIDADFAYLAHMKTTQQPYSYQLTPIDLHLWKKMKKTPYFAQTRHKIKKAIRNKLLSISYHLDSSYLIATLLTGRHESYFLKALFTKFGLSHLLAISGLHFGWIYICLLALCHRIVHSYGLSALIILPFICLYLLFIGDSPSAKRAFFMIAISMVGHLIKRRPKALNTLCIVFILSILIDPKELKLLSFQLSFLATFAILAIYPCIKKQLALTSCKTVEEKLSQILIKACILNFSVSIFTLPLCLYYFHTFAIHSLYYNLIIPPLIGILMIISLITFPFSYLYSHVLIVPCIIAKQILMFLYYPPKIILHWICLSHLSLSVVILSTFLGIIFSIFLLEKTEELRYNLSNCFIWRS